MKFVVYLAVWTVVNMCLGGSGQVRYVCWKPLTLIRCRYLPLVFLLGFGRLKEVEEEEGEEEEGEFK